MSREAKLVKIAAHPIYSKYFKKLSATDLDFITKFIKSTEDLNDDDFMFKANRMFLNGEKPKRHVDIWSIITACK